MYAQKVYVYTNVTVTGHYLSLCEVLVVSTFLSSVEGFLVLTFCCGGPLSVVGFTCTLELLNAIWVAIADPGIVLYLSFLYRGFKFWIYLVIVRVTI